MLSALSLLWLVQSSKVVSQSGNFRILVQIFVQVSPLSLMKEWNYSWILYSLNSWVRYLKLNVLCSVCDASGVMSSMIEKYLTFQVHLRWKIRVCGSDFNTYFVSHKIVGLKTFSLFLSCLYFCYMCTKDWITMKQKLN